jgi:hypothetical protein
MQTLHSSRLGYLAFESLLLDCQYPATHPGELRAHITLLLTEPFALSFRLCTPARSSLRISSISSSGQILSWKKELTTSELSSLEI